MPGTTYDFRSRPAHGDHVTKTGLLAIPAMIRTSPWPLLDVRLIGRGHLDILDVEGTIVQAGIRKIPQERVIKR